MQKRSNRYGLTFIFYLWDVTYQPTVAVMKIYDKNMTRHKKETANNTVTAVLPR